MNINLLIIILLIIIKQYETLLNINDILICETYKCNNLNRINKDIHECISLIDIYSLNDNKIQFCLFKYQLNITNYGLVQYDVYKSTLTNELFIKNIKINLNNSLIVNFNENLLRLKFNFKYYSPQILLNLTLPKQCQSIYSLYSLDYYKNNFYFETNDFKFDDIQYSYKLYKSLICNNLRKKRSNFISMMNFDDIPVYLWDNSLNLIKKKNYYFKLNKENTQIGSLIGKLDLPNDDSFLKASLRSINKNYHDFIVLSSTNELRLIRRIDQQEIGIHLFNIYLKNVTNDLVLNSFVIQIEIEGERVKSNLNEKLIFTQDIYEFVVLSNVKIGSIIGQVNAILLNNNNTLSYSLVKVSDSSQVPFDIDTLNGSIYVKQSLDLKNYEFKVNTNLNKMITSIITILVIDEYDLTPKFIRSIEIFNVTEDSQLGTQIGILNAISIHSNNDHIEFNILNGNSRNLFTLVKYSNTKCILQLNGGNLNFKDQSTYELVIQVSNSKYGLKSTCNVLINVLPGNTHNPRFTQDFYTFSIYENASINSLIGQVNAIDEDIGLNGYVSYKIITDINELSVEYRTKDDIIRPSRIDFSLDENTGELRTLNELDREKYDLVSLHVSAKDAGKPERVDQAMINIEILDVNDNYPLFLKSIFNLSISEDAKMGTYLIRVEANDKDLGQNGLIRYSIKETSPFSIDPLSGTIRVASKLDRELINVYNLTLVANDCGLPSLSSTAELLIHIIDVNDNPPKFEFDTLNFYLAENQPYGTLIANITAQDADIGTNAEIIYTLLDGFDFFELKPTGTTNTISLIAKFTADYESNTSNIYSINLRAYSGSLFTDCILNIIITDINDNSPILENPFKIIFNNFQGFFTLDNYPRIPAYDPDSNDTLTYELVDLIGDKIVELDTKNGYLIFKPILNANNLINLTFDVLVSGK